MGLGKWFNTKAFNLFDLPVERWGIKLKVVLTKYSNQCKHKKMTGGMENQKAQEKTNEKVGTDETPFGPLVIVARKRKFGKRGEKDFETPAQSGYVDHSTIGPINVLSPSMGFPTVGLDSVKDLESSIAIKGHDVSCS